MGRADFSVKYASLVMKVSQKIADFGLKLNVRFTLAHGACGATLNTKFWFMEFFFRVSISSLEIIFKNF